MNSGPSNKEWKLTRPGRLRCFAGQLRCWANRGAVLVGATLAVGCAHSERPTEFTRAVFEGIPEGSNTEDVRRALGTPFMTVSETGVREQLHWCYGNRPDSGNACLFPMLTFVGGKVRSRAWDAAALDARRVGEIAPGLTRAAFEAIAEGSTTEEARHALGAPLMEVHTGSGDLGTELHWCHGKRTSATGTEYSFPMLTFVEGKLRRRAWFGTPWDGRE